MLLLGYFVDMFYKGVYAYYQVSLKTVNIQSISIVIFLQRKSTLFHQCPTLSDLSTAQIKANRLTNNLSELAQTMQTA